MSIIDVETEDKAPKKRGVKVWEGPFSAAPSTPDFIVFSGGPRNGERLRRRWFDHTGQCHLWELSILPGLLDSQGRSIYTGFYIYDPVSDRMVWN